MPGKTYGRIPEAAFNACLGLFLGLSVLAVAIRLATRIRTRHKLYADDGFLSFGLVCMCVATGLAYFIVPIVYLQEAAVDDPGDYTLLNIDLQKLLKELTINDVFIILAWTAEFSAKLSLLFFFRLLVKRLKRLTIYVKFVLGVNIVIWAVLVCESFIICPYFGLEFLTKCIPPNVSLTVGITILGATLDIISDIMSMIQDIYSISRELTSIVLSIPIIILWKARMNFNQKVGIGVFLTMNVLLIVIALVRVTSFKQGNSFDLTWALYFQFFEPNVAILVASFSAFRSLFVNNGSRDRARHNRPLQSLHQKVLGRTPPDDQQLDNLPSIPEPTLNGMRTMIWRNNRTNLSNTDSDTTAINPTIAEDRIDVISKQGRNDYHDNIMVKHDWSQESTKVPHPMESRDHVLPSSWQATSSHDQLSDRQFV